MSDQFERIKKLYQRSFNKHGDSPAALLTPKGRSSLRFRALDSLITQGPFRILDYGCGLGYLLEYLSEKSTQFEYVGVDFMPEFIDTCKIKYPRDKFKNASFRAIEPSEKLNNTYDIIFSSGVFNIATHANPDQSKIYAFNRLKELYSIANEAFVCDFLSSYVDFQQDDAQHFSVSEIADFSVAALSRRFQIHHDFLPYEFTLIVWKDSRIKRPNNVYEVDA
jgi:SAM-dependent methyltransferase